MVAAQTVGSIGRGLASRSDDQVRGPKNVWRFIVNINPENSIAYWLLSR